MPKLIIVRGLPGSGKSTKAKEFGVFHVEADMYHMEDGVYKWEARHVKRAHAWCKRMVEEAVRMHMDVVVSNTFTQKWEFKEYLELADRYQYDVEVLRCTADYGNVHDVPQEALVRMRERFEDYEGEILL